MNNKFNLWISGFCASSCIYNCSSDSYGWAILLGVLAIINLIFGIVEE